MSAKAFRLFVSSTFQDFETERRLLQEQVFPALEAHCEAHGFGFRAVDMRWGVNEQAHLDQRTAEICLDEVIEAKRYPAPNLLILIGDRYGWVPLPFAIARAEFEALQRVLVARGSLDSAADLDRVYQLDENHRMPAPSGADATNAGLAGAYTLRARQRDPSKLDAASEWTHLETRVRAALQEAARRLNAAGELGDADLQKYVQSLTEQEIRKGLERLGAGDAAAQSLAWLRNTGSSERAVRALAGAVRSSLPKANVLSARGGPTTAAYAIAFVSQITARLKALIDAQIAEQKALAEAADFALQTEREIHRSFAAERLRVFEGRDVSRAALGRYVAGDGCHPLVLTGASGAGKTALMARAMMDAATNPDLKVVMRFAGASASSTDQRSLLISVIDDLAALGALAKPTQWESDGDWFVDQVRNCLGSLTAPAVIFIDALDQLRAPYRPMWLPMQLNPNVKIIVSVLDDEAFASDRAIIEGLRGALSEDAFLEMDALDERDGRTILAGLQADAARGLTAGQQDFILERFKSAGASPLYLRLAFNIACRWRSSDHARARGLAADVVGLIGQYLDELSSVHHHEPLLVRRTLGLIAASREGLSEGEAIGALSRDGAVMEAVSSERFGVHTQRLPDSVWLRLRRSLAGLLVEKGAAGEPLMAFFHRQVTEVVRARFYDLDKTELHEALAAYFDSAPAIPGADPAWAGRAFPELPHQLFHAGKRLRLNTILCDPAWIEKKARSPNGVVELLYDYEEFAEGDDPACAAIAQAVRTIAPILVRAPEQVIQQLFGELQHKNAGADLLAKFFGRLPDLAIHATAQKRAGRSLETLRLSAPGAGPSALCAAGDGSVLSGHENGTIQVWRKENPVSTLTIRAHASAVVALTVSQDGRVVSAAHDGSVRVWDRGLQSKFELSPEGAPPTSSLRALSGARLACGSAEGVITLWDLEKRERLREMRGRSSPVVSMVELPGNRLASSSYNPSLNVYSFSQACNVSVWNLEDGSRAAFRDMPTSLGLELFGEERLIVGGLSEIKVLDARDLKEIDNFRSVPHFFLEAPEVFTHVAAIDAARVAVASSYGTIRIWNVDERAEVGRWAAHATSITGLCALHSQDVVSTSVGGGLQFSDPAALAGQTPADAHHVSPARCVALVNIDGATLARGSSNGDVDFWNVETGEKVRRTLEAGISVTGLAFLRGGQIATSIIGDYSAISWDGSSLDALQALKREERRPTCLTTMGDRILVIGFDDGVIRFWSPDVRSRSLAADIEYDNESSALSHLKSKRFRQDGEVTALLTIGSRLVVSGDVNGAVRVWDVDGDRQIAALTRHQGAVRALTAIDKNTFLSAGDDTSIRCWDLAGNPKGAGLSGHEGPVLAMLKLPDDLLLSGAADNTIRLWDRARHTEMSRLTLDAPVTAFAPLGASTFAAGDQLGLLHWLAIKTDGARSNQGAPPPKLNLLGAIAKALRGS